MSLRLPEGMEKSSIGKFATFTTAIAVVDRNVNDFLIRIKTNKKTAEQFVVEANGNVDRAIENYNVTKFLKDTKTNDRETAKQFLEEANGILDRAIENYNAKQFCDATKTKEKTAFMCLREAIDTTGRLGEHLQIAIRKFCDDKKIFKVALKTNEKTANQFLDDAYGDINRAICNFNIKSFCDVTDTDEVTAERFLREADGKYGSTSGRYKVTKFLILAGATPDVKLAMRTFRKAYGGTPVARHVQIAIDRYLGEIEKFLRRTGTFNGEDAKFYLNKAYGADEYEYKNYSVQFCTERAIDEYYLCNPKLIDKRRR